MPKYFKARKAEEVKKFLEAKGYKMVNYDGDDEIWALPNCQYTVKVPSRNEEIPNGTMDYMRKMICLCGFKRKDILDWWKENGYNE